MIIAIQFNITKVNAEESTLNLPDWFATPPPSTEMYVYSTGIGESENFEEARKIAKASFIENIIQNNMGISVNYKSETKVDLNGSESQSTLTQSERHVEIGSLEIINNQTVEIDNKKYRCFLLARADKVEINRLREKFKASMASSSSLTKVTLNTSPNEAVIYFKGVEIGRSPFTIALSQGTYDFYFRDDTGKSGSLLLDTGGVAEIERSVALEDFRTGYLTIIASVQGAALYSGENHISELPITRFKWKTGQTIFTIKLDGYEAYTVTSNIRENKTSEYFVNLKKSNKFIDGPLGTEENTTYYNFVKSLILKSDFYNAKQTLEKWKAIKGRSVIYVNLAEAIYNYRIGNNKKAWELSNSASENNMSLPERYIYLCLSSTRLDDYREDYINSVCELALSYYPTNTDVIEEWTHYMRANSEYSHPSLKKAALRKTVVLYRVGSREKPSLGVEADKICQSLGLECPGN